MKLKRVDMKENESRKFTRDRNINSIQRIFVVYRPDIKKPLSQVVKVRSPYE